MNSLEIICLGIFVVIMGALFSLLGTRGNIISFIVAMGVVFYIIKTYDRKKLISLVE